jgi:hypothetical protein
LPGFRVARSAELAVFLMGDVEARTEEIDHLIVLVVHDRFLERDQIGSEVAQASDEHRTTIGPCAPPPP